jgi:hypothetical protein
MGGTKDHEMPTIRTFESTLEDLSTATEKPTDDLYSTYRTAVQPASPAFTL